jgi:uncharacterized protein
MAASRETSRRQLTVLSYVGLTFAWTWSMWGTAAARGLSATEPAGSLLYLLGVFGPLLGAALVLRRGGRAYRRAFLRRLWDPRLISAPWWLALVAVAAGPAVVGGTVAGVAGAAAAVPDYGVAAVGAIVMFALVAGLAEEPGWRGAALDAWQARTRPVWAATGIGVLWSLWHLPLHVLEGSWYHGMGIGSVRFWLVHLALVQLGVLYVWLANGSQGSILIVVLAHAGSNVAAGLVPVNTTRDVVAFLVLTAATVAVIAVTRGRLGCAGDGPRERQRQRVPA